MRPGRHRSIAAREANGRANKRLRYSEANFFARYRVLVSIPWFAGDRLGVLEDIQDEYFFIGRYGPNFTGG